MSSLKTKTPGVNKQSINGESDKSDKDDGEKMIFPDQNSTNFPLSLKNNLSAPYNKKEYLRYHQSIVYKYMINNITARGLLIFHEMGFGKSILAVAMSEFYRKHDPTRKIVIILSKSLQKNFKNNIKKYTSTYTGEGSISDAEVDRIIDEKYKFISLNASNMFTQLTRIDKSKEELDFENTLKEFSNVALKDNFLENSLVIIDEYHNLSNAITNGSQNAIKLYDAIMNTQNIKLMFLTGTPIINRPFELVSTFNMLRGYMDITGRSLPSGSNIEASMPNYNKKDFKIPLFPEVQSDFDMFFVDRKTHAIKNAERFKNRIVGLCSYYGGLYFGNKTQEGFPTELSLKIERVPMSSNQFSKYEEARDLEHEEAMRKGMAEQAERFSAKSSKVSSYKIKSRLFSNYLIPEYAQGPIRGQKIRAKYIDKITNADLKNTAEFSPKFGKIIHNVLKHSNQPGVVYSEFVSGEGIGILARIFDAMGYKSWNKSEKIGGDLYTYGITNDTNGGLSDGGLSDAYMSDDLSDTGISDDDTTFGGWDEFSYTGGASKKTSSKKSPKTSPNASAVVLPKSKKSLTYAIISGDVDIETRDKIVSVFNSPDNIKGEKISVLLISKTGAEGLDLKNVRHIHITEPFWNYARVGQVIARAVRYLSHTDLAKSNQTVQPYIYLSDYPKDYSKKKKEATTDVDIFTKAVNNKKLIGHFYQALAESSLDCSIHYTKLPSTVKALINCKMCNPNSKPLYHPILNKDMQLPNPCSNLQEQKVSAKSIKVDGYDELFYYTVDKTKKDKYTIYTFDNQIGGYILLDPSTPEYTVILRKILKY